MKGCKKVIGVLLAVFLLIGLIHMPSIDSNAASDLDIQNIKISADGVATWSPYEGADRYEYGFEINGLFHSAYTSLTTVNVKRAMDYVGLPSGSYTIFLRACKGDRIISNQWTGTYSYVNNNNYPQLGAIKNVNLNDTSVSWDKVQNAKKYTVELKNLTYYDKTSISTTTCSVDLSDILTVGEYTYDITIYAEAKGYISSEYHVGQKTFNYKYHNYTITFDANEGRVSKSSATTEGRERLTDFPTPTREDYKFEGWYTAPTGGTKVDSNYKFSGDTTIYAHWLSTLQYHGLYVVNGTADRFAGSKGMVVNLTADAIPSGTFLNSQYYVFSKWELTSGVGTIADPYSPTTTFTMGDGEANITARYTYEGPEVKELYSYVDEPVEGNKMTNAYTNGLGSKVTSTIWYDANGNQLSEGTVFEAGKNYKVNINIKADDGLPYSDDVKFYLNDTSDGVNKVMTVFSMACITKTFTAKPIAYTVSFDTDGGNAISPVNVNKGAKVAKPANPTRTGYTFDDWYSDSSKTVKYNFDSPVVSDITLYAKFNKQEDVSSSGGNETGKADSGKTDSGKTGSSNNGGSNDNGTGNIGSTGQGASGNSTDNTPRNTLVTTDGKSQYYKEDGSLASGEWITINNVLYYFNADSFNAANEWRDGKWISSDGSCTYDGTLTWKSNSTGWWVEDSVGWYPVSSWQKIDGIWYYFNASGYMASNEYVDGYWLNGDGSCSNDYYLTWKSNSTGWWVEDKSSWWPSSQWLKVDGYWYYFDGSGYMATSQYVDGYWIGADGVCN